MKKIFFIEDEQLAKRVDKIIRDVIINDEGGYVFSDDKDGNDGNWTFAGVTSLLYKTYFDTDDKEHVTVENINNIYVTEFFFPLSNKYPNIAVKYFGAIFSCAVNLGMDDIDNINKLVKINNINNDVAYMQFIKAWQDCYIDLVRANADAWHDYIIGKLPEKPKYRRWKYLRGWMNRVDRYRTVYKNYQE